MAQPSVACYFNTRKRSAVDEIKINSAKKVLLLDKSNIGGNINTRAANIINKHLKKEVVESHEKVVESKQHLTSKNASRKIVRSANPKKNVDSSKQKSITAMLDNWRERQVTPPKELEVQTETVNETKSTVDDKHRTSSKELDKLKTKLLKSSKIAELKASIKRFDESNKRLKEAEERTAQLSQSPKIKTFKSIEFEVPISPQKVQSPEKPYLSPKKDTTTVRRNLLNCLSPTKNALPILPESPSKKILESTSKLSLKLPFKYRYLMEMFEGIETVAQLLFNRKETITFRKLKPGVEKLLKRNLTEKHIAQIKTVYPEAYQYTREKLRVFGSGTKREEWELILKLPIDSNEKLSEQVVLERKRKLYNILLGRVKDYHDEFLKSLIPPMVISKEKITRWHPEFDIEKVPDVEQSDVPQAPTEEKLTGMEVLERARQLFNCNTKMEKALSRLQASKEPLPISEPASPCSQSILKGIPQALLDKVRQKQAAKVLATITRSDEKDKEILLYSRLPEIARLTRNIFVAEKKGVLMLEVVVEKLKNCYPVCLKINQFEELLRTISREVPGWIVFHNIRNCEYLKVAKDADLSIVINKLEALAKAKHDS